jgi:FixJ family two-component response regulator
LLFFGTSADPKRFYMMAEVRANAERHFRILTKRQQQIAALARHGLANKAIAHELGLTEGTVKHHLHMIYQKLGIRSRAALIVLRADVYIPNSVDSPAP